MNFSEAAVSLFNESDSYFNLLVFEKDKNINIYKDLNRNLIAANIKDVNFKLVLVDEIYKMDSIYYYKINYQDKIIGYLKPVDSIIIFPRSRQQVKFKESIEYDNELNKHLSLEMKDFNNLKNKIVYSSYYASLHNKIFEGIVYQESLIGFFESQDLSHLNKLRQNFNIIEETILYKDSSLKKEHTVIKPNKDLFFSESIIPDEKVVRFKYEGVTCWAPYSATNIKVRSKEFIPQTPSDALLQNVVYQYKEKLKKSHSYYLKILNKELKNKG